MNAMIEKAKSLTASELQIEIVKLMDNFEDYAGVLLAALLSALESKISAADYVTFCNSI